MPPENFHQNRDTTTVAALIDMMTEQKRIPSPGAV